MQVSVLAVPTHIVYPLSGFEGILVRARLWNDVTQSFTYLGEMENPGELFVDGLDPDQWYWIVIEEFDETQGAWVRVQANWISM